MTSLPPPSAPREGKGEESFHTHKQSLCISAVAAPQPQGITKPHWAFSDSNEKQGQGSGCGGLSNAEYMWATKNLLQVPETCLAEHLKKYKQLLISKTHFKTKA